MNEEEATRAPCESRQPCHVHQQTPFLMIDTPEWHLVHLKTVFHTAQNTNFETISLNMLCSLGQDSSTVLPVVGLVPPDWLCFTTRRTHAMCRSTYRWVTLKEVRSVLVPPSHQQGDSKWTDTTAERCV